MLNGLHRSATFGFSQEFAEYRDYVPGDDPRFVDWNAYARTGRPFVKRFEGETNTRVMVLLDVSASMAFGVGVTKLAYARWLAAALAWLGRRQHDAVGLLAFHDRVEAFHPPSARARDVDSDLPYARYAYAPRPVPDWSAAFAHLQARVAKRAIVAVVSDFYCPPEELGKALRMLGARGHDVFLVHVLDPGERNPAVGRGAPRCATRRPTW